MPPLNETIEELVDRLISGINDRDEIKKRKPKQPSFRYLRDKDEIKEVLSENQTPDFTVMKKSEIIKIVDDHLAVIGLGNVETVENIIQRHQASRKFKK